MKSITVKETSTAKILSDFSWFMDSNLKPINLNPINDECKILEEGLKIPNKKKT